MLISTREEGGFAFDPRFVAGELGDSADVVTITTGEVTYALERLLPPKTQVFRGAARSYPPDFGSAPDWRRSVLRFPERADADDLVEDALAQMTDAPDRPAAAQPRWVRATVELVPGVSGNVARLESGQPVRVVGDRLPPQVRLAAGLVVGEPVEGWLTDRDLAPEPADVGASRFGQGTVTLARVTKVTGRRVHLRVHPALPDVILRRRDVIPGFDDGDPDAVIPNDIVVGRTVRARVVAVDPDLRLSLVDVGADEPLLDAPPLLRGGGPWLRENAGLDVGSATGVAADRVAEAPTVEAAPAFPHAGLSEPVGPVHTGHESQAAAVPQAAATTEDMRQLRNEVVELRGAVYRLARELRAGTDLETLDELRDSVAGVSTELRRERGLRDEQRRMITRLKRELAEVKGAQPVEAAASRRTHRSAWPSAEAWVRHEVQATWAERVDASEKQRYPLPRYTIGPAFAASLEDLDGAHVEKALRVVVDVLTGRAADISSRGLHRLRSGVGGDDPCVERADGAKCWRAAIESNVPSARRLHYWQLPGGAVELSRVVSHDDYRP